MPHRLQPVWSLSSLRLHLIVCLLILGFSSSLYAQVGIGTTTPKAFFHVSQGQTVLFGEDSTRTGITKKLIWYASQGAFRVGGVMDNSWNRSSATDNTNVGQYSFASGFNTKASGPYSTAMGVGTTASGDHSTALNFYTTASGQYATAMGHYSTAKGHASVAMGYSTTASGHYSLAMGINATASGYTSTALGYATAASGQYATAIGHYSSANGDYSTAIGNYVSTNGQLGSFILGDYSTSNLLTNDRTHQMVMRFAGGYKLYTNSSATIGVTLSDGDNAWQTLSDSTRKENFRLANGVDFLKKIAKMRLGSWNYKGQDVNRFRHYGPMAQEFFAAFGHDELGNIGEEKSINQADFDGVNLIAIQALIKEVEQLKADNQQLRVELEAAHQDGQTARELAKKVARLEALMNTQVNTVDARVKP